jgi:hypothetical protein
MRLSALGTAQGGKVPTYGNVEVPLPLPYAVELTDGWTGAPGAVLVALVEVIVCGVTGVSTGTLALEFDAAALVVVPAVLAVVEAYPPVPAVAVLAPVADVPVADAPVADVPVVLAEVERLAPAVAGGTAAGACATVPLATGAVAVGPDVEPVLRPPAVP